MRKIILFIHSSINGVVTGDPSEDKTNWTVWRNNAGIEEGSRYLLNIFKTADTILLGRGTYEDLSRKWPNTRGSSLGDQINNAHKLVVTSVRPLDQLKWGEFEAPKQLTGNNIEEQIKDLKNGDGGDIVIFGSPTNRLQTQILLTNIRSSCTRLWSTQASICLTIFMSRRNFISWTSNHFRLVPSW